MSIKLHPIDHDPFASRRQPQQGERLPSERAEERGSARESSSESPRERRDTPAARPDAPKDPADDLMQGGD